MAEMKCIRDFAVKWIDKFRDQKIDYIELVDHFMADDCNALGFEMDCGNAFSEKYGDATHSHEALEMRIVSNNIYYGSMPQPDDEVEQHFTINKDGRVWFGGEKYEKARGRNFKIEKTSADRIFAAISVYFSNEYNEVFATDIGDWTMELTNTDGVTYKFWGRSVRILSMKVMIYPTSFVKLSEWMTYMFLTGTVSWMLSTGL